MPGRAPLSVARPGADGRAHHARAQPGRVPRDQRHRLRLLAARAGPHALQRLPRHRRRGGRVPADPLQDPHRRAAGPAQGLPATSASSTRGWWSSPAPPAAASRPPWPRWSTGSTPTGTTTSSPSRTRSSSSTRTRSASSTSARWGPTPRASRPPCGPPCARIPDIVLVGEMRDLETVAIAIETAETGHLVFGTLHTNTAPSTVDRLIDQFPTDRQSQVRVMLSESLKGVVAQTLLKQEGRRAGGGARDPRRDPRGGQPDPRGQDLPDPLAHADRARRSACRR